MSISDPPREHGHPQAEGSLWHDIRDLTRFVAEAALISGGIILAALALF